MLPAMTLTRPLQPMPDDIASRLDAAGLRAAYDARPPYQRNDYLGWIARAKRPETREKRLAQMLSMHPRTLNRRLKERGTTFRSLLAECRFEISN